MAKTNRGCGIAFITAAVILSSFLLIIVIAMISGIMDGEFEVFLSGIVLGAPLLAGIIVLFRSGLKNLGVPQSQPDGSFTASPGTTEGPGGEQILAVTTIAGSTLPEYETVPSAPEAATATVPAPAPEPARQQAPSRTGLYAPEPASSQSSSFEKTVLRSSDVFATLRDFAAHRHDNPYDAQLSAMLGAIGIADWSDAPKIEAVKLGRSGNYWLGSNTEDLSIESLDRFLGIECALNVSQAMRERGCSAQEVLKGVADLEPMPSNRTLPGVAEGAREQGEWMARLRFAEFAENVPAPFRMAFGMQANIPAGLFVIDLSIPRPASMAFFATNDAGRICTARAYALRSALLCARKTFELNPSVTRVVVNCGTMRDSDTLLSFGLDRPALDRLIAASRNPGIDGAGFPTDPSVRASFDASGWFQPVEPFISIDDESVFPDSRRQPVELDFSLASEALSRVCGAQRVCDLGINENANRLDAWKRYISGVGSTTGDAVARLVAIRDAAQDVSVAEAADRVSKALVEGSLDVSDTDALARLFIEGGLLDTVALKAREEMNDPDRTDLEPLLQPLLDVLSPIMSMGLYLDDSDQVFRYFNSAIERIWFNLNLHDRSRQVRLVPDTYYMALSCTARILSSLDRGEEALVYSDELMRIAPATPDAALVRVRVLENMSRIYDCVDLLEETISRCSWINDLAVCFYRLAYMEWKLGRSDLAVACYERSISFKTSLVQQAREELEDLIQSDDELSHLSEEEALEALKAAGIPTGDPDALRSLAARAAIVTTDEGLLLIASALTGTLIDSGRDDVLADIYQSLRG